MTFPHHLKQQKKEGGRVSIRREKGKMIEEVNSAGKKKLSSP